MRKYHLFQVYGIELEYMLVNSTSYKIIPIVEDLLTAKNGSLTSDLDNGDISWSNELVAHVIELKTNGPTDDLENLDFLFYRNILEINLLLKNLNAELLPTAAHPLMDPKTEMHLWPYDNSEIYELYNNIFNCTGHGWSNVQSVHLNLPFYDDVEFTKLHAAIRILLPIIPALSASSPIFDGKAIGSKDGRLEFYKTNQKRIPMLTGKVIPEQVFDKEQYYEKIFKPIKSAINEFDKDEILDAQFLNSRGAIARFDRNAIEIRLLDIQECPLADMSILILIIEVLKVVVNEKWANLEFQKSWHEEDLAEILNDVIINAEETRIENLDYLSLFEIDKKTTAQQVWKHLYATVKDSIPKKHQEVIELIFKHGSLATRILNSLDSNFKEENILKTYRRISECLKENKLFIP